MLASGEGVVEQSQPPDFDRDNWTVVARIAVVASLLLWLGMGAILSFAAAPQQCPGWHLEDASSTSLWALWLFWGGPLNALGCFIVLRWDWAIQKSIEIENDHHWLPIPMA